MKPIFTIALAAAMMVSCGGKEATGTEFATDSVKYENKEKMVEVTIRADYPTTGNALLTNAIEEYISETLGGTYTGDLKDGKAVADFYGNEITDRMKAESGEYRTEDMPPLIFSQSFGKEYETVSVVTYTSSCDTYNGGAHGLHVATGTTFRKSDGRRFGQDMLRDTDCDEFRLLIKEGLKEYFGDQQGKAVSDEELKDMLITDHDINYLPLPQGAPYMTEKGMTFVYQAYEIAPYAAGLPTFVVPYGKMKPFMTVTAQRMVE